MDNKQLARRAVKNFLLVFAAKWGIIFLVTRALKRALKRAAS